MKSIFRRTTFKSLIPRFSSPFSTANLGGLLAARMQENSLKDAIRFENQNRTWTYKEIEQHSDAFAYGLVELGYKRGDRLLLWIDRAYTSEITIAQIGMAKAGVSYVPLLSSNPEDLRKNLKDSECRGLIFSANTKEDGRKRADIFYDVFPELEKVQTGTPISLSEYPKLKHFIHTGFHTLPGTFKYRQLLVYGNPNFQTNKLPQNIDEGTPLIYAKSEGKYKEYTLKDISDFAEKFRSSNQIGKGDAIVVTGCPYCPGTFASGAYQSLAYGNFVALYGNESFKSVVEKLKVQQPSYVVLNQKYPEEDLKASTNQIENLKKVFVSGKETGAYQSAFGGKPVSSFSLYW